MARSWFIAPSTQKMIVLAYLQLHIQFHLRFILQLKHLTWTAAQWHQTLYSFKAVYVITVEMAWAGFDIVSSNFRQDWNVTCCWHKSKEALSYSITFWQHKENRGPAACQIADMILLNISYYDHEIKIDPYCVVNVPYCAQFISEHYQNVKYQLCIKCFS